MSFEDSATAPVESSLTENDQTPGLKEETPGPFGSFLVKGGEH